MRQTRTDSLIVGGGTGGVAAALGAIAFGCEVCCLAIRGSPARIRA